MSWLTTARFIAAACLAGSVVGGVAMSVFGIHDELVKVITCTLAGVAVGWYMRELNAYRNGGQE